MLCCSCVDLREEEADIIDKYFCPPCRTEHGPIIRELAGIHDIHYCIFVVHCDSYPAILYHTDPSQITLFFS